MVGLFHIITGKYDQNLSNLKKVKRSKLQEVQEIALEVTNTTEMIDVVVNAQKG